MESYVDSSTDSSPRMYLQMIAELIRQRDVLIRFQFSQCLYKV